MKLAVDARMVNKSGIGTCIQQFLSHDCYSVAMGNERDLEPYREHFSKLIPFESSIYGYKEQIRFPYRALHAEHPDVLHVPHCNIPLLYRGKMIVTVHDLTHLIYPEFLPFKAVHWYFKYLFGAVCRRADHIMADSESTKRDLLHFYHPDPSKISVVPLGVGSEFVRKEKSALEYLYERYSIPRDKKLILYVGNLLPHKNLEKLMEAFSKMPDRGDCRLILVGKAFENYAGNAREKELGIENLTIHTGMVSQEALVDLYNLADLFALPSLYEGFGLPVLEALACGTPVACSNASSLPEVGGSVVDYFDPLDAAGMAKVLESGLDKKGTRDAEIREWLTHFDWAKTSAAVVDVARSVLGESR